MAIYTVEMASLDVKMKLVMCGMTGERRTSNMASEVCMDKARYIYIYIAINRQTPADDMI